jgi:hypothetical protein
VSWNNSGQDKSCADVAAHYGNTVILYSGSGSAYQYQNTTPSCDIESFLMGTACSSCTSLSTPTYQDTEAYNAYNPITHECYYTKYYYNPNDIGGNMILAPGLVRVCRVNNPVNGRGTSGRDFSFPFTPNF